MKMSGIAQLAWCTNFSRRLRCVVCDGSPDAQKRGVILHVLVKMKRGTFHFFPTKSSKDFLTGASHRCGYLRHEQGRSRTRSQQQKKN